MDLPIPQMMACSLNGLSVGETLTENLMESPARSDTSMCYHTRYISVTIPFTS